MNRFVTVMWVSTIALLVVTLAVTIAIPAAS